MARLRWRRDRNGWEGAYRDENGERKRKLYKGMKKAEAEALFAAEVVKVQRIKERLETREGPQNPRLQDLANIRREWLQTNKKPRTVDSYDQCIRPVLEYLQRRNITRVQHLKSQHLERYKTELCTVKSSRTVNKRLGALKSALNHAVRSELIDRNPIAMVRPLPDNGLRERRDKTERRALRGDEIASLLKVSPHERRLMWWTFLTSGLRSGELCNLKRADFDSAGYRLRIRGETAKRRERGQDTWQPIPRDLVREIAAYLLTHRHEPIFPNLRGRDRGRKRKLTSLLQLFYRDCRNAGIDLSPHDVDIQALRVTYLTHLAANPDLDVKTLQELARHKHIATTMKHYVRVREKAVRQAVDTLSLEAMTQPDAEESEDTAKA